jgi:RNA polymerase sigma-70 factor (ECF subfamily)
LALRQEELTSLSEDVDLERDSALVERCQEGDSAAFANLYARYYERLLRFCLRRLNDRHEAEDAAQEAFARAWKALPRFAGERRFYPWLTVIAGNICTDLLRRRSRSTPTDDVELTAQQVGVAGADTSEELVLAAVDGELVNQALDRLSTRHRHVLAMREGSGWTYQEIADHEGVEIGTIETLLWRARQALKREFAVVSEWKGALAGFLVAGAALFRRTIFRVAHRGANVHSQSGNSGGLRNALAGAAVTGAAVAAALITPHALSGSSGSSMPIPLAASSGAAAADPSLAIATPSPVAAARNGGVGSSDSSANGADGNGGGTGGSTSPLPGGSTAGAVGGLGGGLSGVSGAAGGLQSGLGGAVGGLGNGVGGVTKGLGGAVSGTTNNVMQGVGGAVSGLGGAVSGVVGGVTGSGATTGTPSSGGNGSSTGSTTQTTNPGLLGGLTQSADNTLNGLLGG